MSSSVQVDVPKEMEAPKQSIFDKIKEKAEEYKRSLSKSAGEAVGPYYNQAKSEVCNIRNMYVMKSKWYYVIILLIAVSGMIAMISTIDLIVATTSNLKSDLSTCKDDGNVSSTLNIKFWWMFGIFAVITVIGIVISIFNRKTHKQSILVAGMLLTGILGIIVALIMRFRRYIFTVQDQTTGLWITSITSWIIFVIVLVIAGIVGRKTNAVVGDLCGKE